MAQQCDGYDNSCSKSDAFKSFPTKKNKKKKRQRNVKNQQHQHEEEREKRKKTHNANTNGVLDMNTAKTIANKDFSRVL